MSIHLRYCKNASVRQMTSRHQAPSLQKLRETCPRQGASIYPCFADANPLYLDSCPSASQVLLATAALLSVPPPQLCSAPGRTGPGACSAPILHRDPWSRLSGDAQGHGCQLSPALRRVGGDGEQSLAATCFGKGSAFSSQSVSLGQLDTHN